MPPESLPDRLFKERKYERSDSLGPSSRWRDNSGGFGCGGPPHHHGSSSRWSSADFRRPGHGKLGWHSEDSGSRGGGEVKYARRENRVGFSGQKEWKGQSWETTASPNGNSNPHFDFVNSWDQLHSKEHDDKNGGVSNTGQRVKRENSLETIDWKPLKWTRSRSLSSRGSGFSHSSSSKSMGVDSVETKFDSRLNNVNSVLSPSGDAAGCIASGAPAEDNSSRKKPRLGWGQGLAKYEKKKVDGPDEAIPKEIAVIDIAAKDTICDGASDLGTLHSNRDNVMEKSPSLADFSECASPTTPSSVACSSSPGVEEKSCSKTFSIQDGACNPSSSICTVSKNQFEGLVFSVENLEHTQFLNLSSSLNELLQSDDSSLVDSGFVSSTALNKLSVWKSDISKTLEVAESEIDMLENEFKSLVSDSGGACPCPAASISLPAECKVKPSEELCAASSVVSRPSPLKMQDAHEQVRDEVKDEDIDSPGSATSKFVEPLSLKKDVVLSDEVRESDCLMNLESRSENLEMKHSESCVTEGMAGAVSVVGDGSQLTACVGSGTHYMDVGINHIDDMLHDMILTSNRESANRASEVFSNLLPTNAMPFHISRTATVPCSQNELHIKEKFAMRKRFLKFKERVIILKFRAFQHLWKEDLRLLSIKRFRSKAQKKYDLGSRFLQNGFQKHRSSIRSRFLSPGNLSLVPTTDVISYANQLLTDSKAKVYRDTLKMPALIMDKNERRVSRFISNNGLVEDPCAIEKERSMINPWTPQETDIFLSKLSTLGKDFKKIASFLDHKTTADCVEFYYKNHKSDMFQKTKKSEATRQAKSYSTSTYMVTSGKRWNRETNAASLDMLGVVSKTTADCMEVYNKNHKSDMFQKTKKKSDFTRQAKSYSANTYMVTSRERWNRETNAASLDMLGAVSEIAANTDDFLENREKCTSRFYIGTSREYKKPQGDDSSLDVFGNERETAAADVLAGICGSLSSEAMSSCITSSIDPGDVYPQDCKRQKAGGPTKRRHATPEVTQSVIDDETCSDESCGEEIASSDWTDEEKSLFIQAVASFGKDFAMISRCMRTRSRDQCKIYFSKAQKCLGLDMIHPEPCSIGTTGANGGHGSDGEDACIVETGCKTEEQELQLSDLKVENIDSAPAEYMNLAPDLNQSNDKKDVELKSDDLAPNDSEVVEDKPEIDLVSVSNTENCILEVESAVNGATEDVKHIKTQESEDAGHAISEEVASMEERDDHCLPSISGAEIEKEAIEKLSVECSEARVLKDKILLPVEASLVSTISEVNGGSFCPAGDLDSAQNSAVDRNSSLDTAQKPCVISLDQDNCSQAVNSRTHDAFLVHHRKALSNDDTSTKHDFRKSSDMRNQKSASTGGYHQHLPMQHSLLDCVESSQILRGYPITLSNKNEMNGDVGPNEPASSVQSVSNLDRNNFHVERYLSRDSFLHKCNGSRQNGFMSELPFLSRELKQKSPSEVEKPCTSGNVKLFGQILSNTSSQPLKPSCSSTHEKQDKGGHHSKLNVGRSFNLKFGDNNQGIDRNSFLPKFEQNNYLSVENNNQSLRSYGFWDGNRIQTGLPSLPDSAILLAKYPAAFGSSLTSTSRMDSQPLRSSANNTERGLNGSLNGRFNGVSVFPTRKINGSSSSGSRVPESQLYRNQSATKVMQPFTVDQLRQDFLTQMQRRREIELLSASLQQGRRGGTVGLNMAGGREGAAVLVGGGLMNGVSDPVAAIKMHYAKSEQFGGNIREDESWRGNR